MRKLGLCVAAVALAAGTSDAKAAQPVLHVGSRSPIVAAWQQALNVSLSASSWDPRVRALRRRIGGLLRVDGVFGRDTLVVTEAFQRLDRERPTGTVALGDWVTWMGGMLTMGGPAADGLRDGDFAAGVGWWQISLNRWLARRGQRQLIVDCTLGPDTRAAVRVFQRDKRLPVTGALDFRTWKVAERLNLTHFP